MVGEKLQGPFVKAIPLAWLTPILSLSGSATKAALLIWYLSGVKKTKKDITVTYLRGQEFGINKSSLKRGLNVLESNGFILVIRGQGKAPRVTIIEDKIRLI